MEGFDTDDGGSFIITGSHTETHTKFTKEYIGKHKIEYEGSFSDSFKTLTGKWHIGEIEGEFSLKLVDRVYKFMGFMNHLGVEQKVKGLFAVNEDEEIEGLGVDEGGVYSWEGRIEEGNKVRATKIYQGKESSINYEGDIEGLIIKGRYNMEDEIGEFEFNFEDSVVLEEK